MPANLGAKVTHSLDQTIENSTTTTLTFDTEEYDGFVGLRVVRYLHGDSKEG